MGVNLIEALSQVKDFRAARGQRYPLWLVLLLVIMGTMSGCRGYGALEEFGRRHPIRITGTFITTIKPISFGLDISSDYDEH